MSLQTTFMGIFDTARICVPTVVDAVRGRVTLERCDERLDWWARKVLEDADVDLVVRGREHAAGTRPFVVMSNHQSLFDIPVVFRAIPGRLRMIAKKELFHVPIFGQAMKAAGFIRINRGNHVQASASLQVGASMLQDGTRVWIAPEGTRSKTGALLPFKSGGFRMAIETNTPILPVAIDGTRRVLRAKDFVVQQHHRVVVTIMPPIDPAPYGAGGRSRLMRDVRAAIAGALGHDPGLVHKGAGVATSPTP
ncbi:lysophospholipid acyltransferase family protein [Sorangium sp. So ce1153]|uniref:lysophospholipid acyltransferase family protein n=1 Tax=Sorangium sp. So ce1153 TaxID=3133333 RepID=UPI003F6400E2